MKTEAHPYEIQNTFVRTFVTFTKHYEIANGTFVVLLWYEGTKVTFNTYSISVHHSMVGRIWCSS